ncbi:MAG: hypothetical protein ACI9YR_002695 [Bacteroidia bacterium]
MSAKLKDDRRTTNLAVLGVTITNFCWIDQYGKHFPTVRAADPLLFHNVS